MKYYIYVIVFSLFLMSCKKQEKFLDIKPTLSDVTPVKLEDFQSLLDNDEVMNTGYPALPIISSDNFALTYESWQSVGSAQEKNAYVWAKDIYEGEMGFDWSNCYRVVEYANIALKGLDRIKQTSTNKQAWNNVKGSALFYRAFSFYYLAQTFARPYSSETASTDLGICLRLSEDINEVSVRSTLKETYAQILKDLTEAENLLPVTPLAQTRPSKPAAEALMARVYLTMNDYVNARKYAESCLEKFSFLMDYNLLDPLPSNPFPRFVPGNKEVIFFAESSIFLALLPSYLKVDTVFYNSYDSNDLRKTLFFNNKGSNNIGFRGNYTGLSGYFFFGLASNEIYLIRAECNARLGNVDKAMDDLNYLLNLRWKTGTFIPLAITDSNDALKRILEVRRKELPFSSASRWIDLRRLNSDPRFSKDLSRDLDGQIYTLPANDNRYTFPIPDDEVRLSKIQQNPR